MSLFRAGGWCRACRNQYSTEYRAKNLEKRRAQALAHYHRNSERYKEQARAAYREDPARREAKRAYEQANHDRLYAAERARILANPEPVREAKRAWEKRNPEAVRRKRREGMARRKALLPITNYSTSDTTAREYMDVLRRDSCAYCGARDDITIDHIDPIHLPGADDLLNLTAACRRCNGVKADRRLLLALLELGR
jgi:5-methylcytosine-specific restriction endonuclease McrA